MSIIAELPTQQAAIYRLLDGAVDVSIDKLYEAVGSKAVIADSQKVKQQFLGPYIVRLNRRLAKHRRVVKPGALKGTYTLKSI
jgi:hypothetical protein